MFVSREKEFLEGIFRMHKERTEGAVSVRPPSLGMEKEGTIRTAYKDRLFAGRLSHLTRGGDKDRYFCGTPRVERTFIRCRFVWCEK